MICLYQDYERATANRGLTEVVSQPLEAVLVNFDQVIGKITGRQPNRQMQLSARFFF